MVREGSDPCGQMGHEASLEGSLFLTALESQRHGNCASAHRCGMGFSGREERGNRCRSLDKRQKQRQNLPHRSLTSVSGENTKGVLFLQELL